MTAPAGSAAERLRIRTKRIYDPPAGDDGCRVLVDRLWPRGVAKDAASWELWLRNVAPSAPLRKEFSHRDENFEAFAAAYRAELEQSPAVGAALELLRRHGTLTLLYAARNTRANHAAVVRDYLLERAQG